MYFIIFFLGLLIGSFLNVCIYRIPNGQSIVKPRSKCGNCQHTLGSLDLMPVLSWVMLRGKCRYCKEKISIRYALVEILTGLLFVLVFYRIGLIPLLLVYFAITSMLIVDTFIDFDHQIIPNGINLFGLILFVITNTFLGFIPWLDSIIGCLIGGGFLLFIVLISGGAGMGVGDVKLMGVLGLFLGWKSIILALLLSFIIGGIFGSLLLITGIKGRKDAIPFGPWISIGALISLLFGEQIIEWYINLLL